MPKEFFMTPNNIPKKKLADQYNLKKKLMDR